jgi:hypothetical protein
MVGKENTASNQGFSPIRSTNIAPGLSFKKDIGLIRPLIINPCHALKKIRAVH